VGLLDRLRGRRSSSGGDDLDRLREWAAAHHGVEAFVEPRTTVTPTTVLLVDADGAWTRGRVSGPAAAIRFARKLALPIYDAQIVGYPQRMRDHDARERILRRRRELEQ
jgi:hypothetical protein